MRRAMGPFLTTGVALVAATVVVANPLAPPSRDMQISTTQLSTSPNLLSPADKSLLNALAPALPPAGIGPALAQILAALAADADRISREVNSDVSTATPVAAALPEQIAYRPEPVGAAFVESPNTTAASATTFATSVVSTDVQQALNGLFTDTSYLGGKVFEAAYAVVDVIIRAPQFVVIAVTDLLNGDFAGALDTVQAAVRAFFGPGLIILDGVRNILFGKPLPAMALPAAASEIPTVSSQVTQDSQAAETEQPTTDTTATPSKRDGNGNSARNRDGVQSAGSLRPTVRTSKPAAAETDRTASPVIRSHSAGDAAVKSRAGSARDVKAGASAGSSAD